MKEGEGESQRQVAGLAWRSVAGAAIPAPKQQQPSQASPPTQVSERTSKKKETAILSTLIGHSCRGGRGGRDRKEAHASHLSEEQMLAPAGAVMCQPATPSHPPPYYLPAPQGQPSLIHGKLPLRKE